MGWKLITPEEADELLSIGTKVWLTSGSSTYWYDCKDILDPGETASKWYHKPEKGGWFRVEVE